MTKTKYCFYRKLLFLFRFWGDAQSFRPFSLSHVPGGVCHYCQRLSGPFVCIGRRRRDEQLHLLDVASHHFVGFDAHLLKQLSRSGTGKHSRCMTADREEEARLTSCCVPSMPSERVDQIALNIPFLFFHTAMFAVSCLTASSRSALDTSTAPPLSCSRSLLFSASCEHGGSG